MNINPVVTEKLLKKMIKLEPLTYNDLIGLKELQPKDWGDIIPDIEF